MSLTDVSYLRSHIYEIYNDLERRNSDMRDLHGKELKDMETNHELTLYVQSSLTDLHQRVARVDGALVGSTNE